MAGRVLWAVSGVAGQAAGEFVGFLLGLGIGLGLGGGVFGGLRRVEDGLLKLRRVCLVWGSWSKQGGLELGAAVGGVGEDEASAEAEGRRAASRVWPLVVTLSTK